MEYQRILSVFLHHPHISPTTHNIIHALLYNCYNQDILARSLVSSITHQLDFINHDLHMNLPLELVQDYWFTLAYDELHPTQLPPSRNQKVEMLLATAYNDVAYQWMTDFLLYRNYPDLPSTLVAHIVFQPSGNAVNAVYNMISTGISNKNLK